MTRFCWYFHCILFELHSISVDLIYMLFVLSKDGFRKVIRANLGTLLFQSQCLGGSRQKPWGATFNALLNLLERFWKAIRPVSSTSASSSK